MAHRAEIFPLVLHRKKNCWPLPLNILRAKNRDMENVYWWHKGGSNQNTKDFSIPSLHHLCYRFQRIAREYCLIEWLDKLWYIHTTKYYTALKIPATCINQRNTVIWKKKITEEYIWFDNSFVKLKNKENLWMYSVKLLKYRREIINTKSRIGYCSGRGKRGEFR